MQYKFDDEENLGKAIENVKPFCKLVKSMDVPEEKYIVGDFAQPDKYPGLVANKWSKLCGFTFKAKNGKLFQFVYVPKLKGFLSRNHKALSGWYCWTIVGPDNKQVTSIIDTKLKFNFDINKFVHSDLFDKCIPLFKSNVLYVLDNQIKQLLSEPHDRFDDYQKLCTFVSAIKTAIGKIDEVKQFVTVDNKYDDSNAPDYAKGSAPKIGHAKIAYNADKTYDLRNDTKSSQKKELLRRAADRYLNAQAKNAETPQIDQTDDGEESIPDAQSSKQKSHVKYDPSLKFKFGGGRTKKDDDRIFDKYDDYDNDDFR